MHRLESDRLTAEEASEVARLHAHNLADRERLAATTEPEELAEVLGTSPEVVRRLVQQVRSASSETRVQESNARALRLTIAIAILLLLTIAILDLFAQSPK